MPCLLNSAHFLTLSLSVAVVHLHTAPPESLADTARRFAAFTLAGGTTMLLPTSAKNNSDTNTKHVQTMQQLVQAPLLVHVSPFCGRNMLVGMPPQWA